MISYNLGRILLVESILLILPAVGAIIYGDDTVLAFAITIAILAAISVAAIKKKPQKTNIYAKEGYVIVAFSWILMSFFGAIPFFISNPNKPPIRTATVLIIVPNPIITNPLYCYIF